MAATITLPAAAAALVAPGTTITTAGSVALSTTCAALTCRLALLRFLVDPAPRPAHDLRPIDPFVQPSLFTMNGRGPRPDGARVRTAGDRCVFVWQRWRRDPDSGESPEGIGGALALGAWCSWALGSPARALVRARHAVDVAPEDVFAALVLRTVEAGVRPGWD